MLKVSGIGEKEETLLATNDGLLKHSLKLSQSNCQRGQRISAFEQTNQQSTVVKHFHRNLGEQQRRLKLLRQNLRSGGHGARFSFWGRGKSLKVPDQGNKGVEDKLDTFLSEEIQGKCCCVRNGVVMMHLNSSQSRFRSLFLQFAKTPGRQ